MTKEELIKHLEHLADYVKYSEDAPALREAIALLSQSYSTDLISRQDAIDALAKFVPYAICDESTESYTNGLTDAYNLICQLPAQPEKRTEERTETHACDLISRLSEIRSQYNCFNESEEPYYRALSEVIKKLSEQADGDTISRQDAIDALNSMFAPTPTQKDMVEDCLEIIENLPSVQPIITCKDCYWWTKQEDSLQGRCDRYGKYPTGYWFCASARERREE